jgi:DNA-binding transcriptional MerR regulator
MKVANTKLLSMAAVSKAANVGRETLRFYEEKGLIKPLARTTAGYRQFTADVIERIGFIKQTQQAGFKLREIQQLLRLRGDNADTCGAISPLLNAKLTQLDSELAALQVKRAALSMLANTCGLNASNQPCNFVRQGQGCC